MSALRSSSAYVSEIAARPIDGKEQDRPGTFCIAPEGRAHLKMAEALRRHGAHGRERMFRMGVDGVERAKEEEVPINKAYRIGR